MKIPFGLPIIDDKEKNAVLKVLSQPVLAHGKQTSEFEKKFTSFTKAKTSISTSSCTAGMHLFYMSIGLKKNDEVIMSSQTHVATAHAVEIMGGKPIFVDSDLETGNIDIDKIEKKITKKTKVITVVHFLGIPVDMKKILKIAKKYNLFILEDCALSVGTKIDNIHVGLWGDAGVFSFYPVKHMTTGEGGIIISKNLKLRKKIILSKSLGINKNFLDRKTPGLYDCVMPGLNYRMSEINSAIGIQQLKKINFFLKKRKNNFEYLFKELSTFKSLRILKSNSKRLASSNYCMTIILQKKQLYKNRTKIIKNLNKKGIGTSIYYPHSVPGMKYYKNKYNINLNEFKNAENIGNRSIAIPVGPHLGKKELDYILINIKKILKIDDKKN